MGPLDFLHLTGTGHPFPATPVGFIVSIHSILVAKHTDYPVWGNVLSDTDTKMSKL